MKIFTFRKFIKSEKKEKVMSVFKTIYHILFNPITLIIAILALSMFCIAYFHTTPKKYVGEVIEVSSWDGNAVLKTKTYSGKDTLLDVHARKYERFEVGQIITVWTGGDLFEGIATTEPQH